MNNAREGDQILVLDNGYVRFIEAWGSDERIIEAARMSTDKGFVDWQHDAKLLSFLYKNKHMTPFEMAGMVLEIKAPIFVFREWHRHRTQSYNEMSARYIPLPDENYLPSSKRILEGIASAGANKQARGHADGSALTVPDILVWLSNLSDVYERAQAVYEKGLLLGVPKELARLPVPVARYSRMRASANLRNWLSFLELRSAEGAQWEIRQYARAVATFISVQFPRTYTLFAEGKT